MVCRDGVKRMYRKTTMLEEMYQQPAVLQRLLDEAAEQVQQLAQRLQERDVQQLVIAARGTSDHAAVYGKYVIEYLTGIPVALAAPSLVTLYKRRLHLQKAAVIGISQSGEAEDVRAYLQAAADAGSLTISITNEPESSMAREAQNLLLCRAGTERALAATKTYTAQMLLLFLLAANLAGDDKVLAAAQDVPRLVTKALASEEAVRSSVERYRYMEECAVLGRGLNYATALETALKIQETCYVVAKGASSADFLHGPIALIEDGFPCLVYALKDATWEFMLGTLEKLHQAGAEIVLFTDALASAGDGDIETGDLPEDVRARCQVCIPLPAASTPVLSPLSAVVAGQLFANYLALARRLDPDKPRTLSKVTKTL